jgi:hypothetical protein
VVLIAVPLPATANTPAQRLLGRWWKRLQRVTYVVWGMIVLHLLLLDRLTPFGGDAGDGDPVFHQLAGFAMTPADHGVSSGVSACRVAGPANLWWTRLDPRS